MDTPPLQDVSQSRTGHPFRTILLVLIIIGILVGGGYVVFGKRIARHFSSQQPTPTKEQLPTLLPTDTPVPQVTPTTAQTTPTTAPKPTNNPIDKATGLDRSTLSITIENGSGVVGAASKASDILTTLGYHVIGISNADSFNYDTTVIKTTPTKSNFVSLLQNDLSGSYTIGSASATLAASSSADALVIVGKQ